MKALKRMVVGFINLNIMINRGNLQLKNTLRRSRISKRKKKISKYFKEIAFKLNNIIKLCKQVQMMDLKHRRHEIFILEYL